MDSCRLRMPRFETQSRRRSTTSWATRLGVFCWCNLQAESHGASNTVSRVTRRHWLSGPTRNWASQMPENAATKQENCSSWARTRREKRSERSCALSSRPKTHSRPLRTSSARSGERMVRRLGRKARQHEANTSSRCSMVPSAIYPSPKSSRLTCLPPSAGSRARANSKAPAGRFSWLGACSAMPWQPLVFQRTPRAI